MKLSKIPGIALAALLFLMVVAVPVRAQSDEASPFVITPTMVTNSGAASLSLAFRVPAHHRLYADALLFELRGRETRFTVPEPVTIPDKHSGGSKRVFEKDFVLTQSLAGVPAGEISFAVNLHGCNDEECFFPETRRWVIRADHSIAAVASAEAPTADAIKAAALTTGFRVAGRSSGFLNSDKFLQFLSRSDGQAGSGGAAEGAFAGLGILATIGLILIGGLALNLTPCVLPMIPINLAILGAGSANRDRKRGFALGGAYGTGMALAYGTLGLVVVLTGSKFGALNSSPWFNFGIALVFIVLGLSMFDLIAIDLSRFQRAGKMDGQGTSAFAAATMMGSVSALLAGACVAPVVISVLLLAATFYQKGNALGLLLPFVLGLGMALPWPFAAAGLSFLPKPGGWMTKVKYGFGVIILAFSAWYGWLGWSLSTPTRVEARVGETDSSKTVAELRAALDQSRQTGRPVLVDFWASWCKNCAAMEHSTFQDKAVQRRMNDYIVVKFQAERLSDPAIKPVLDELGVMGLPTCVVLKPANEPARLSVSDSKNGVRE